MFASFIARRILQSVPTVFLIVTACFFLLRLAPGDVVDVIAGQAGAAAPGYVEELRAKFGLDRPLWEQYLLYTSRIVELDLGFSFHHNMPVVTLIVNRLGATLLLGGTSLVLAVVFGVALGSVAATRFGRLPDRLISFFSLVAYATPSFWVSLMLIVLFGVKLKILPTVGMTSTFDAEGLVLFKDVGRHLILPAFSLSLFYLALFTRVTRAAVLDTLSQDYLRTASSKGISDARIFIRHVLPNAAAPVLSIIGVQVSGLFGGAVLVETVFGWPGLGRLSLEALLQRDFNLLLGILLCSSMLVVTVNIFVDIAYRALDPRISTK